MTANVKNKKQKKVFSQYGTDTCTDTQRNCVSQSKQNYLQYVAFVNKPSIKTSFARLTK